MSGFCGCVRRRLACPKRGSVEGPLPLRPAKELQCTVVRPVLFEKA